METIKINANTYNKLVLSTHELVTLKKAEIKKAKKAIKEYNKKQSFRFWKRKDTKYLDLRSDFSLSLIVEDIGSDVNTALVAIKLSTFSALPWEHIGEVTITTSRYKVLLHQDAFLKNIKGALK